MNACTVSADDKQIKLHDTLKYFCTNDKGDLDQTLHNKKRKWKELYSHYFKSIVSVRISASSKSKPDLPACLSA